MIPHRDLLEKPGDFEHLVWFTTALLSNTDPSNRHLEYKHLNTS